MAAHRRNVHRNVDRPQDVADESRRAMAACSPVARPMHRMGRAVDDAGDRRNAAILPVVFGLEVLEALLMRAGAEQRDHRHQPGAAAFGLHFSGQAVVIRRQSGDLLQDR